MIEYFFKNMLTGSNSQILLIDNRLNNIISLTISKIVGKVIAQSRLLCYKS